jgi:hypothetical protein
MKNHSHKYALVIRIHTYVKYNFHENVKINSWDYNHTKENKYILFIICRRLMFCPNRTAVCARRP